MYKRGSFAGSRTGSRVLVDEGYSWSSSIAVAKVM